MYLDKEQDMEIPLGEFDEKGKGVVNNGSYKYARTYGAGEKD